MTVTKDRGRGEGDTQAEGRGSRSRSPLAGKKGSPGQDEDFASLFNGGPGDSPAASDASSTLDVHACLVALRTSPPALVGSRRTKTRLYWAPRRARKTRNTLAP